MSEGIEIIRRKLHSLGVKRVEAKVKSVIEILERAKKDPTIWNFDHGDEDRLHCNAKHGDGLRLKLSIHVAPQWDD